MELRQLRYFVRIVELGGLSRAAADLYIAQPALSQQLANLEAELGVRLLNRSARGVTPTEAGNTLYRHAQAAMRLVDRIRTDVQHAGDSPAGVVSLGMPTSVANILAAPLVAAVRTTLPDVRLQITESLSGHLAEQVATGRIEMTLLFERHDANDRAVTLRKQSPHLDVRPLLVEELFLLTAGDGPFGAPVTLAEAAAWPLILPGRVNATRQIIDEAFAQAGLRVDVVAELDSLATIKSVVAGGHGATILSASALAGASPVAGVVARRITDSTLSRLVSLCTYDIGALSSAAVRVSELVLQVGMALVHDGTWVGARALLGETDTAAADSSGP
ncbi:MAG: LysR substrate-binding domain-containing protein [Pseudomonadota bacterium]